MSKECSSLSLPSSVHHGAAGAAGITRALGFAVAVAEAEIEAMLAEAEAEAEESLTRATSTPAPTDKGAVALTSEPEVDRAANAETGGVVVVSHRGH